MSQDLYEIEVYDLETGEVHYVCVPYYETSEGFGLFVRRLRDSGFGLCQGSAEIIGGPPGYRFCEPPDLSDDLQQWPLDLEQQEEFLRFCVERESEFGPYPFGWQIYWAQPGLALRKRELDFQLSRVRSAHELNRNIPLDLYSVNLDVRDHLNPEFGRLLRPYELRRILSFRAEIDRGPIQ